MSVSVRDLRKSYPSPAGGSVDVLDIPALNLEAGEQVALIGSSGTGKTTLLHILAGIVPADSGTVTLAGVDLTTLGEAQRDRHRADHLGYVFQTHHLLPAFTALENVLLGMSFGGRGSDRKHAETLLDTVGLADRFHHRPAQLSVGQRQRVAVARALANRPTIVLADEPTGSLDPDTAQTVLELLRRLATESSATLLLVTHNHELAATLPKTLDLAELNRAGRAIGDPS
ncbi:MAG: ABC transporter ATP-binding protein [Planctomycetota bacterium]